MNIHESVSSRRFKQIMKLGNHTMIDVRTPEETKKGKIETKALEINYYDEDFEEQINKLDKNKRYLVYCRSGSRSEETQQIMKKQGFKEVYNLANGILEWNETNK